MQSHNAYLLFKYLYKTITSLIVVLEVMNMITLRSKLNYSAVPLEICVSSQMK